MPNRKPFAYITKKYHITRPGLYKRINKIPHFKENHMTMYKNRWLIDLDGIKLITKPKHNSTARVKHTRKGIKNKMPTKPDYFHFAQHLIKLTNEQQETITKLVNQNAKLLSTNQKLELKAPKHWWQKLF